MEREKETFLYEEREQKLKDQQMYMNLMREHPEEVREIYIEDPTIPSPDSSYKAGKMQEQKESDSMDDIKVSYIDPPDFVQKKDNLNESDSFYNTTSSFNESYIRNSREMDAQKEWNEKMQERKDYSINNQDKEEIISPVKELLEEQDSQHKTETDNVMKGKNSQKESNSVPSSASSSFNESNLRNSREIDAQKEWEQKMKERSQTDKTRKPVVVFIDYLQLLKADPKDPSQTDRKTKIDRSAVILKTLASQIGMPVVTISSISRNNYNEKINTSSFKESGDLEYTGGVLLGWDWCGVTDVNRNNIEEITSEKVSCKQRGYRRMRLSLLKYRNAEKDNEVLLRYYPAYNYFASALKPDISTAETMKYTTGDRPKGIPGKVMSF